MAITARTFTMPSVSSGTTAMNARNHSWCMLTPTRMVTVYGQQTPARRMFAIIDNPDGIASASVPTMTPVLYNDTVDQANVIWVQMLRLSDTTFAVVYSNASFAYTIDVFSVNGTAVSLLKSGTATLPSALVTNYGLAWSFTRDFQSIAAVSVVDNQIIVCATGVVTAINPQYGFGTDYTATAQITQWTWNPNTSVLSSTVVNNIKPYQMFWSSYYYGISGPVYYSFHISPCVTPGQFYLTVRNNSTAGGTGRTTYVNGVSTYEITGAGTSTLMSSGGTPAIMDTDFVELSQTRAVRGAWDSASFYNIVDQPILEANVVVDPKPTAGDLVSTYPYTLRLSDNYFAVVDGRQFVTATTTAIKAKIFRRVDTRILEASPASTGQYGFTITAPVPTITCWSQSRPVVINQNIMWAGYVSAQPTKFTYTVVIQPPLPN